MQKLFESLFDETKKDEITKEDFLRNKLASLKALDMTAGELLANAQKGGWDSWLRGLTLDELLALLVANPDYLTDVLLYHVAHGRRDSADVIGSERIRTLQGGFLMQDGGVLTDNLGRKVGIVAVDIMADNGIIHVLNNVVLPYLP